MTSLISASGWCGVRGARPNLRANGTEAAQSLVARVMGMHQPSVPSRFELSFRGDGVVAILTSSGCGRTAQGGEQRMGARCFGDQAIRVQKRLRALGIFKRPAK